jgi:hypothetical protein
MRRTGLTLAPSDDVANAVMAIALNMSSPNAIDIR